MPTFKELFGKPEKAPTFKELFGKEKKPDEGVSFLRQIERAKVSQQKPSLMAPPEILGKAKHPIGGWLKGVQIPELKGMTTEALSTAGEEMTKIALPFIKKPSLKTAWEARKRALKPGEDMLLDQLRKTSDWGMLMSNVPAISMMGFENIKKTVKEQGLGAGSQGLWNMIMAATGVKWIGKKVGIKAPTKVRPKVEGIPEEFDFEGIEIKPKIKPKPEPIAEKPVPSGELWKKTKADFTSVTKKFWESDPKRRAKVRKFYEENHKLAVERALREGKPVPPEVLKDYPDLKPVAPIEKPAVGEKPPELAGGYYTPNLVRLMEKWFEKPPKGKEPITPPDPIIDEIRTGLELAKPLRKEQQLKYTEERGKRLAKSLEVRKKIGGLKGFYAEKAQFKGEMPKVKFEPIMEKLSPEKVDYIVQKVTDAPYLAEFEKLSAREGLVKALEGSIPTEGELGLLNEVFGSEFVKTLLDKRGTFTKMKDIGLELANVPRSIMASFDLSFGLRQGAFAAPKFRKEFWDSWKRQFELFGRERAYQELMDVIKNDPDYVLAREAKISFTEMTGRMGLREEPYMGMGFAEKIPIVGRGIRASGRAYTGFANKYRLEMFKTLVKDAERMGLNPRKNPFELRGIGDIVNTMTGRGSITPVQSIAPLLNAVFFSPRLMASRLKLFSPYSLVYYTKLPKYARQQALKSLIGFAGAGTTILTGLSMIPGVEVGKNPWSADFGKIIIKGKTRVDLWGGFQPIVRATAQIISGQYVSTVTGKVTTLGEGYRALNRKEIILRQIESKAAPVASLFLTLLKGKDWKGKPINIAKEVGNRFVPMVLADMLDLYKEDPKLLPIGTAAIFGVGLQTYETYPKEVKRFNSFLSKVDGIKLKFKSLEGVEQREYKIKNRDVFRLIENKKFKKIKSRLRTLSKQVGEVGDTEKFLEFLRSPGTLKEKSLKIEKLKEEMARLAKIGLQYTK